MTELGIPRHWDARTNHVTRTRFDIYPSWFGGVEQANSAVCDLAERTAVSLNRGVVDIMVDRSNPDCWIATVELTKRT